MNRAQFDEFINGLPTDEQAALLHNHNFLAIRDLARRLAAAAGSIFTRQLDYTGDTGIIGRLVKKGGPWGYMNAAISDENYPVKEEGIVAVRYRVLRGAEIKRADGYVYRADVESRFRTERMRCPNAAEALLVPAEDKEIGRGEHPLVAFLRGSSDAFFVGGSDRERRLGLFSVSGSWGPLCDFLGVCE